MPEYSRWIAKGSTPHVARCVLCSKDIDISTMAEGALRSHSRGTKHSNLCASASGLAVSSFFQSKPSSTLASSTSASAITLPASQKQSTMSSAVSKTECLKSEVLWTLKVVKSHYSFHSSDDINDLFVTMFPDSAIARQFTCGETKVSYLCTFGLAPYFKSLLTKNVNREDGYVLLFDETLNVKNKMKQMDVHVRFWSGGSDRAEKNQVSL